MSFNSSDIQSFKNVWVFCEQRQGVMMPTTFELISEGRKLANELGVELCGILLGDNVKGPWHCGRTRRASCPPPSA